MSPLFSDAPLNANNALLPRLHGFRPLIASDGFAASPWCQRKVEGIHYPDVGLRKLIGINMFPCAMPKSFSGMSSSCIGDAVVLA